MGQIDDRKIHLSGLKSGVYTYRMQLDDAVLEGFKNEEIKGGKVDFDIKMEKNERVTMLTIAFKGEVRTECDRCLGEMMVAVSGDEVLNIRFSDSETSDDEETVILPEGTAELDLTPWLYEYVAVRIPLQHSHPDGECDPEMTRYIADGEQEHADDYVDPRWEALKKLK